MKKTGQNTNPQPETKSSLNVNLRQQIIDDLKTMERNSGMSVDELVSKAVLMFIATHGDYLGKRQVG